MALKAFFHKNRLPGLALAVFFLIASGCTHTIQKSQEFSGLGIKYADAIKDLIDVTTETVVDDDSDNLLYTQRLTSYDDKKKRETSS